MLLFKVIIWSLFFYLAIKAYRFYKKVMKSVPRNESNVKSEVSETSKIDKADIIDAEFEDLPVSENTKGTSHEDK